MCTLYFACLTKLTDEVNEDLMVIYANLFAVNVTFFSFGILVRYKTNY